MKTPPRLSIIIPTYGRPALLDECLKSLSRFASVSAAEFVVVAHEADNLTLTALSAWRVKEKRLRVVLTGHRSRSKARNDGARVAEGEWFYFLDDDAVVELETLSVLAAAIGRNPEAAAIGGPNAGPEAMGPFESSVDRVLTSRIGAGTMSARYCGGGRERPADERHLISCSLAVRREAFERFSGFDGRLDYGEETFLLARMRLGGEQLVYSPGLRVRHRRRLGWGEYGWQVFRSGRGRALQTWIEPRTARLECLAPAVLGCAFLAAFFGSFLSAFLAVGYLGAVFAYWALAAERSLSWRVPILTIFGHAAYAAGLFWGFGAAPLKAARSGFGPWAAEAVLAANRFYPALMSGRFAYQAALWATGIVVRAGFPQIKSLWVHRGNGRWRWTPGGSDIDLIAELSDGWAVSEKTNLLRWKTLQKRLRRIFPMLGEVQLSTRDQIASYLADGSIRAHSLPDQCIPVFERAGAGFGAAKGGDWTVIQTRIGAWNEQLHAYRRLVQGYFEPRLPMGRRRYHAVKLYADILRWEPVSRGAGLAACVDRERTLAGLEIPREMEQILSESAGALERSAGGILAEIDSLSARPFPDVESGAAFRDEREESVWLRTMGRLAEELEGRLVWAVHDSVFGLSLGFGREDLSDSSRIWRNLRTQAEKHSIMSGTILPLCPSSARLMLVSGAEEDPLAWSSWRRAVRHGAVERSGEEGTVLGRQLLCGWNLPEALVAPFPNSVLRPSAESAWSRLGFHWRSVWTDGADSDLRRWFYLFGRAMSLRLLLERGELVPVFPLSRLAHRYGEAFHGEARGAAERVLSASSLSGWADSAEFFSGIFSVRFEKKSAAIRIC